MNNELFELYTIFQWNGKDLFLRSTVDQDRFVVKTFSELTHEFREFASKWIGREVMLYSDGRLRIPKTREELQADADRRHRHLESLRHIRAFEENPVLSADHQKRLNDLRAELAKYEPVDPTATTSEQQRANRSVWGENQ